MLSRFHWDRFISDFNSLNTNVRYLFVARVFGSMAMNIYFGIVFSVFVKAIVGTNYELGIISSIVGVVSLFGSLLGGWLADRWRRDVLIKMALVMDAAFTILFAIFATDWITLVLLLSIINFSMGLGEPARRALLADSVPQGERSRIFSYFFAIETGGGVFSPVLSIVVALYLFRPF